MKGDSEAGTKLVILAKMLLATQAIKGKLLNPEPWNRRCLEL